MHRKMFPSYVAYYKWICADNGAKSILQVLCMNCNWAKRTTKVCPHQANEKLALKLQEKIDAEDDDGDERLLSEMEMVAGNVLMVDEKSGRCAVNGCTAKTPHDSAQSHQRQVGLLSWSDFDDQNESKIQQIVPESASVDQKQEALNN